MVKRHVTMSDVAAHVGVSKMTDSRALNRSSVSSRKTSDALHERILTLRKVLLRTFGASRDRSQLPGRLGSALTYKIGGARIR